MNVVSRFGLRSLFVPLLPVLLMVLGVLVSAVPASAEPSQPQAISVGSNPVEASRVASEWVTMRPGFVRCSPKSVSKTKRIKFLAFNDAWVDVVTKINFDECIYASAKRRIDPINWKPSYNLEGSSYPCNMVGFNGVKLNLYLKDGTGANYHPPQVTLPCEDDTTAEDVIPLSDSPVLRYCFGAPQWKTNITVKKDLADDIDKSHDGYLWTLIGPVPNDC